MFEALALAEYESAWGLSTAATKRILGTLADRSGGSTPLDEVMLALACLRAGMNAESERLARRAEGKPPADVPTAAFLLQLQATRGGEAPEAVRFLLAQRAGKGWRTTIEGAWAILGLAAILDRGAGEEAAGRIVVTADGAAVRELALPGRVDPSFDGRISVAEPPGGWGEKIVVRLSFEGRGTAFYTAAFEALKGGEATEPVRRGLEVYREYLQKDGESWRPVERKVRPGSAVLVHLWVASSEPREYVMVSDPRPDGFEPVDREDLRLGGRRRAVDGLSDRVDLSEGWAARLEEFRRTVRGDPARESTWAKALLREIFVERRFQVLAHEVELSLPSGAPAAAVEHRDDRTLLFLERLHSGVTHLYYIVRPELAGAFHALPAEAGPMYEPEIYGSGAEHRIEVSADEADPARPRTLDFAPGVEGLAEIVGLLDRVDADEVIGQAPANPRIGDLLMRVADDRVLRKWLSADPALRAAGTALRERIEAARRDLATRRLAVEALSLAPEERLPVLEGALASDDLPKVVTDGADAGDLARLENALLWAAEDRALRMELLAECLRRRMTAEIGALSLRPVTLARIVTALGSNAPVGDALVRWKLSQRGSFAGGTLAALADWLERDLALGVRIEGDPGKPLSAIDGRVSEILFRALRSVDLFYRVRDGALRIGPLDRIGD